jgi:hypothetical protein
MIEFQPQTLACIAPTLSIDTAVHRLLGWSPRDTDIAIYAKDTETLADLVVVAPPPHRLERLMVARRVLLHALCGEDVNGYLAYVGRDLCLQIPRLYWLHRSAEDMAMPFDGAERIVGGSPELNGTTPVLSSREFDLWLDEGRKRLADLSPVVQPLPVRRVRPPTAKFKGVEEFLRYFDRLEHRPCEPGGQAFFDLYRRWCQKNTRPSFVHSGWDEALARIRSSSALMSAKDNCSAR